MTVEPENLSSPDRGFISRRGLLGAALAGPFLLGTATACAAVNPATVGWLATLATNIGASMIATELSAGLAEGWEPWTPGVTSAVTEAGTLGYPWYGNYLAVHPVPPVILTQIQVNEVSDPLTDGMVATVSDGAEWVVFPNWAWQGLAMYVANQVKDRSGDDLAAYRALCAISLAPAGVADKAESVGGSVEFMTYLSRNGLVELGRLGDTVRVTPHGIPDKNGNPLAQEFELSTTVG